MEHRVKLTTKNKGLYDKIYKSYMSLEPLSEGSTDIVTDFVISCEETGTYINYTTKIQSE
jgi:hypothetical protein